MSDLKIIPFSFKQTLQKTPKVNKRAASKSPNENVQNFSKNSKKKFQSETEQSVRAIKEQLEPSFHLEDEQLLLSSNGNKALIEVIIQYGKNRENLSSLEMAIKKRDFKSIKVLLEAGAKVSRQLLEKVKDLNDLPLYKLLIDSPSNNTPLQYDYSILKSQSSSGSSTDFELESYHIPLSFVSKPFFSMSTSYLLKGPDGIEASSTLIEMEMGLIFPVEKTLLVEDEKGEHLGRIEGVRLTSTEAQFLIYDPLGETIGVSFLDHKSMSIKLVSPTNYSRVIARIQKLAPDQYNTRVYQGQDIHLKLLKIFSVFAVDTESLFEKKA